MEKETKVRTPEEWTKPLVRVLEGHEDLLRITSDFPKMGRLPGLLVDPKYKEWIDQRSKWGEIPAVFAGAAVVIVVIVVCVAVAARPSAVDQELLRAKLLDVYTPRERETLREAISIVQKNPDLVKATLGIDHSDLGKDFMGRLNTVETNLT
jgi:hypothetical protein